jgi:hypothetical protein
MMGKFISQEFFKLETEAAKKAKMKNQFRRQMSLTVGVMCKGWKSTSQSRGFTSE